MGRKEESEMAELIDESVPSSAGGDQNDAQTPAKLLSIFSHLKEHPIQAYVPLNRLNPL